MKTIDKPIVIVGAGIAGCFMAIVLAKKGFRVNLIEKFSMNDMISNNSKRTFNITIYGYGLDILKKAGLWGALYRHVLPLLGSVTQVSNKSKPIHTHLDPTKKPYFAIQRASLIKVLLEQAATNKLISFHFEHTLTEIDTVKNVVKTKNSNGIERTFPFEVVLGADGVNSKVRQHLQKSQDSYHSQEYANWSYKQIWISPESVKKLGLNTNYAHTWTRKHAVIATFPNIDKSVTAILILPQAKWTQLTTQTSIKNFIRRNFTGLMPILPDITTSLLTNPEGNFVTVHTEPWYSGSKIAIIGDAAHGCYPFFGQGISAALGDCMTLLKLISRNNSWEEIFYLYEKRRKVHMDAMGELSKEGFNLYRRNKKADYLTIYNKLEDLLHSFFPKYIQPSIFESIVHDPEHTADYVRKHNKQRVLARYFGIPFLVALVTSSVRLLEETKGIFVASKYYQTLF